jgi:hypothetical protein
MTLVKAQLTSLSRTRPLTSLYRITEALLTGNERDRRRAREFVAKAKRIERGRIGAGGRP